MENYKGIYFGTNTEQKSFEGGAHFRYKELYRELKILYENLPNDRKGDLSSLHDTTIATRNARCPIVQNLTEKIKEITRCKIEEMNQDLVLTLKNTNFIDQEPVITEEIESNQKNQKKTNTNNIVIDDQSKAPTRNNKNLSTDILKVGHNTKNTVNNISNNVSRNKSAITAHNRSQSNMVNPKSTCQSKHKLKIIPTISISNKKSVKNLNTSKPKTISHIKTTSNINSNNRPISKPKNNLYNLIYNYNNRKKTQNGIYKGNHSHSKPKLQINNIHNNNNIIIKPKINISFINNITNTEPNNTINKKSRNSNTNTQTCCDSATINKTFNFGILTEMAKKKNIGKNYSRNKYNVKINSNGTFYKTNTNNNTTIKKDQSNTRSKKNLVKLSFDFDNLYIKREKNKTNTLSKSKLKYK